MQTSYFAKLRGGQILYPVSICRFPPKWYTGPKYFKLAPSAEMLAATKRAKSQDEEDTHYFSEYDSLLSRLNPVQVVQELQALYPDAPQEVITLLCFEATGKPCHRHLVARWLTDAGFPTQEF